MAREWKINLSGSVIPVYEQGEYPLVQVGKINKNECFCEGTVPGTGYEGDGYPVVIVNSEHDMTPGYYPDYHDNMVDFVDYASNGKSWVAVDTLKRKVKYATRAYYADGSKCCSLAAGSYVWLTSNGTGGSKNPNYIAVTKVQTAAGKTYEFSGNGFVDLTYGDRWVNVGSILLRKAD